AAARISAALESGDSKLAERIAHTVKGVAGNIGMVKVQSAAQKLEKAIHERPDSVAVLLPGFASCLSTQVDAIEEALHKSAPAQPEVAETSPFNGEVASSAIARLRSLLKASDGGAEETFRILQAMVAGVVEKQHLDALRASISDFEFEAALVKLDEIAEQCARNGDTNEPC